MCSKPYDFDGFVGDFKELMIQFVQMKQSLGFDYVEEVEFQFLLGTLITQSIHRIHVEV
jgi:hypothetical protein